MNFLWPNMFWLVLAVPVLIGLYVWLLRRRKRAAIRYASLALVHEALGVGQRVRRHVPPALFLVSLVAMVVALARPTAVITLPTDQQTIMLAIDVSLSMRVMDIPPSRIEAAKAAAKAFVDEQPPHVKIGIVTFAGTASVVQPPTRNHEDLKAAVDRFQLQRATAIGSGLMMSLATLFPDGGIDVEAANFGRGFGRPGGRGSSIEQTQKKAETKPFKAVEPGSYSSAVIILLTDGRSTVGPDPIEAARMAAERGVRVYTVGFGTKEGGGIPAGMEGWSYWLRFDETTLKQVAELTKGEYFHATSADDLKKVYEKLNARYVLEKKETEVSAIASGVAALLAMVAAALSLVWYGRVG